MSSAPWTIVGQGLAGTCLAWEFWKRELPFTLVDREQGGSSRVAAGLINPVTGKNFEPSTGINEFMPQAMDFYADIEHRLKQQIWHPLPLVRLAQSEKEWSKILSKTRLAHVRPWLANDGQAMTTGGWVGAIQLKGGGRLDTRTFLDQSKAFFQGQGCYRAAEIDPAVATTPTIWCEGARGLMRGRYGPHRCAKGEILTLRAANWKHAGIRIGAGGWLVPVGHDTYKVGSTYEWNELDEQPTAAGRSRVEEIARQLGGEGFEVIAHEAGIRPILRRSEPLIGPLGNDQWMFNGLGSKGSLYGPSMAQHLAAWLIDQRQPATTWDIRAFLDDPS